MMAGKSDKEKCGKSGCEKNALKDEKCCIKDTSTKHNGSKNRLVTKVEALFEIKSRSFDEEERSQSERVDRWSVQSCSFSTFVQK